MGNSQRDERAIFAYEKVKAVVDTNRYLQEYRSLAVRLPAMIQMQGLSMAMTYLQSKFQEKNDEGTKDKNVKDENSHYKSIYDTLVQWLQRKNVISSKGDPLEKIFKLSTAEYRYAMEEVLQLSIWLKQLAEGMIESDD